MPVLRRFRFELLVFAAVASVGLGWWGFDLAAPTGQSTRTSLYNALGLFGLENGGVADPVPWQLDIARFLAPATALAAAISALAALFDQQIQRRVARYVVRDHVIVVGLNPQGIQVAREFAATGQRVTLAGLGDGDHPDGVRLRRLGIPTVSCDGTSISLLDRTDLVQLLVDAGIRRSRAVIVMTGDDETNAQIAGAARDARPSPVDVYVEIDDLQALRSLGTRTAGADHAVETYSIAERSARALVDQIGHRLVDASADRAPCVVVAGDGAFADHVVLHLLRSWALDQTRTVDAGARPTIVLAGRDLSSADAAASHFATWEPRAIGPDAACRWSVSGVPTGSEPANDGGIDGGIDVVVVAHEREVDTLADAVAWAAATAPGTVVACPHRPGGIVELSLASAAPETETFCRTQALLAPEYVLRGFVEDLAMGLHWSYRRHRIENTVSNVAWHRLSESDRAMNRSVARHLLGALRDAGISVRPLQSSRSAHAALEPAVVETLARAYHAAWCDRRLADGWSYAATRDDTHRRHPLLVDWDRLAADDRGFNLTQAADLPQVFALLGRELHVPS